MKKITIAGALYIMVLMACNKIAGTYTPSCSGTAKSFTKDVSPLINANCVSSGCHGTSGKGGPLPFTTYEQIAASKANIRSQIVSGNMPRGGTLTTDQKNTIVCWIDAGALKN